jgi:hypothetical protein
VDLSVIKRLKKPGDLMDGRWKNVIGHFAELSYQDAAELIAVDTGGIKKVSIKEWYTAVMNKHNVSKSQAKRLRVIAYKSGWANTIRGSRTATLLVDPKTFQPWDRDDALVVEDNSDLATVPVGESVNGTDDDEPISNETEPLLTVEEAMNSLVDKYGLAEAATALIGLMINKIEAAAKEADKLREQIDRLMRELAEKTYQINKARSALNA